MQKTKILLVTATPIERRILFDLAKSKIGIDPQPNPLGFDTYHFLGCYHEIELNHVQTEKGASGIGSSQETVDEGIRNIKPDCVIMLGLAFGINPEKQRIGDILISNQILPYEFQRIGTLNNLPEIISRGDKPHSTEWLFKRFDAAGHYWEKNNSSKIFSGLLFSGEKLIDNFDFRSQLYSLAKDAIGGEMEGGGLYTSSTRHKKDWIVIKAISDWADGKKRYNKTKRQEKAAENSAAFVFFTIEKVGLTAPSNLPQTIEIINNSELIRILIANDSDIERLGLKKLLEVDKRIQIIGEANSSPEVSALVNKLNPDILIIDLKFFGDATAGIEAITEVRRNNKRIKIIAVTAYENLIPKAKKSGANVALSVILPSEQLLKIIDSLYKA